MKSLNFNFDCIGLTETLLKGNEETNIYNMSGYTLLSKTRSHKRGGGVGLYISDDAAKIESGDSRGKHGGRQQHLHRCGKD